MDYTKSKEYFDGFFSTLTRNTNIRIEVDNHHKHGNQFSWYTKGMVGKENGITEYFEDVETEKEYNGYLYSVSEAITIVISGSISRCENVSRVHQLAEDGRRTGE